MTNKINNTISGGKAVVECLKAHNVKFVFGLIGSATMEIFDALYHEKDIKFIGVRDERTGAHMADGYARASNRPGVILAGQNGPGATNLVTGIAQAAAAFSPVISIAGFISTKDKIKDAFQGVDQQSLFKPITKKTWTLSKVKKIPKNVNIFDVIYQPLETKLILLSKKCGLNYMNGLKMNLEQAVLAFNHVNAEFSNLQEVRSSMLSIA